MLRNLTESFLSLTRSYLWNTKNTFALDILMEFVKCFDLSQNQSMRKQTSINQ